MARRGLGGIPRLVWLLGLASFFNDVSSEALFPLLPLFLAALPGGSPAALGIVEGAADAVASALKVAAGRLSDRGPRRLLVTGGYALPAAARGAIAMAALPWHVLAARLLDRVGKGMRAGPRDALLADAARPGETGRAFGLQRSMDHLGAALGPLLASGLLAAGLSIRGTFWVAAALGLAAPVLLAVRLRDPPLHREPSRSPPPRRAGRRKEGIGFPCSSEDGEGTAAPDAPPTLPPRFRRFLALAFLFALGNSTDAFLLLKGKEVGFSAAVIPLLWFGHHLVKTLAGLPGGVLSDRVPRAAVVAAGWGAYALSYLGFALAEARWQVAGLFGLYALYHGLAEGAERALVADLAPPGLRGRAFGWYHGAVGAAALPAGLATGWLWQAHGSSVALGTCAALAGAAAFLLAAVTAAGGRGERVAGR